MPPYNRLEPYRFVFPQGITVTEATETALLLDLGLLEAEQDGPGRGYTQVRPVCYWVVLTTLN